MKLRYIKKINNKQNGENMYKQRNSNIPQMRTKPTSLQTWLLTIVQSHMKNQTISNTLRIMMHNPYKLVHNIKLHNNMTSYTICFMLHRCSLDLYFRTFHI